MTFSDGALLVTKSVFTVHPRRAHAARATPPRPRKASAVRGDARSKMGSWERVPPPHDARYTSARHTQDRTAASACARVPRAARPKTVDTSGPHNSAYYCTTQIPVVAPQARMGPGHRQCA